MENQDTELDKADEFPEGSNTEVSQLRTQLLQYRNELAQVEEREYQMNYKIEWYIFQFYNHDLYKQNFYPWVVWHC